MRLPRLLEDLAADQHAADFARSGADFVELGVAQEAAGRVIVDVAVAAEALDGLERHPGGAFGGGVLLSKKPPPAQSDSHGLEVAAAHHAQVGIDEFLARRGY